MTTPSTPTTFRPSRSLPRLDQLVNGGPGFQLLEQLLKDRKEPYDENVVFSPLNISVALGMLLAGLQPDTEEFDTLCKFFGCPSGKDDTSTADEVSSRSSSASTAPTSDGAPGAVHINDEDGPRPKDSIAEVSRSSASTAPTSDGTGAVDNDEDGPRPKKTRSEDPYFARGEQGEGRENVSEQKCTTTSTTTTKKSTCPLWPAADFQNQMVDMFRALQKLTFPLGRSTVLSMANVVGSDTERAWIMDKEFQSLLKDNFPDSYVLKHDMENAPRVLNKFVEEKSNGRIKNLVPEAGLFEASVPGEVLRMYLISCLFFKGTWTHQFEKENTQAEEFYLSSWGAKKRDRRERLRKVSSSSSSTSTSTFRATSSKSKYNKTAKHDVVVDMMSCSFDDGIGGSGKDNGEQVSYCKDVRLELLHTTGEKANIKGQKPKKMDKNNKPKVKKIVHADFLLLPYKSRYSEGVRDKFRAVFVLPRRGAEVEDLVSALSRMQREGTLVPAPEKEVTATAKTPFEKDFKYQYNPETGLILGYTTPEGLACKEGLKDQHIVRFQPSTSLGGCKDDKTPDASGAWLEFPPCLQKLSSTISTGPQTENKNTDSWQHTFRDTRPLTIVTQHRGLDNFLKKQKKFATSQKRPLDIYLPRFKSETACDSLADTLSGPPFNLAPKILGRLEDRESGFVPRFSHTRRPDDTLSGRSCVTNLIHQAVVELDEEGTTAAAATLAYLEEEDECASSEDMSKRNVFRCNEPFVFAIEDRDTGAFLFLGVISHPTTRMLEPGEKTRAQKGLVEEYVEETTSSEDSEEE
ncbi:unnamed protein product [Amoebophrya sp. A25]|nr:unnamed protein product [Amoebophrya sp. A25]|eukprot:GSA25T00017300001.1